MSLNSLQDDMSRRAASMAAMAKRARNPQEIQAIQKSLITGVQSGAIQPHVGIPLIQDLTKELTKVKAQMAQSMAGAGMPQPPQGGAPIAQQIMAQAAQANQEGQGVETLPSNLPESYAGGGIIAFEGGGQVERFQNTGSTGTTPAGRFFSAQAAQGAEYEEAQRLRNEIISKYGPSAGLFGLFKTQTDAERQAAQNLLGKVDTMTLPQLKEIATKGPAALPQTIAPTATPYDPATATRRSMFEGQTQPPAPAAPSALPGGPGAAAFKMPDLQTFTPTPAVLPERAAPVLTDLNSFVKDLPEKTKEATETAITKTQKIYEDMDKPGFEARESRLGKREATQEKDSAISRALNLMNLGFGIAGSKERTLAGALGNEGRQGIRDLIQGEAANRAARDRLEEYRDNLEQQKVAAKKGNYQAAQAAGDRAADNLYKYQNLNMTAASAGNSQAIQRQQVEQQGDIGRATIANQGQQIQQGAVSEQNRNAMALATLNLQRDQLVQTGAFQTKQLEAMDKRYAALDKQSQARMAQVRAGAMGKFMETVGPQLNAQLSAEYGKNWRAGTDPRSLEAQMRFKQAQNTYIMDALGQYETTASARDSSDL
jgi:hypothetical protein